MNGDVAKYIFDAIKDDVDAIEQLPNGIIVATKKGAHPGPRCNGLRPYG